ncbi:MAG: hypothetical protein IPM92_04115 [Saprospiraceae bacterium]|nr:hypothetical protein [Saprospiraceae bacterium]
MPDIIPIHYHLEGRANGFEAKVYILILLFIATVLFIGPTIANNFHLVFSDPLEISSDKTVRQYTNATRMIGYLLVLIHFA